MQTGAQLDHSEVIETLANPRRISMMLRHSVSITFGRQKSKGFHTPKGTTKFLRGFTA